MEKEHTLTSESGFLRFCRAFVCVAAALCAAFFAVLSFFGTCMQNSEEKTVFTQDNLLLNAALPVLAVLLLALLHKVAKTEKAQKTVLVLAFVFAAAVGLFWVLATRGEPAADAYYCYTAAQGAATGDFGFLGFGSYMYKFPYQLGYVWVLEILFRIFGVFALTEVCTAASILNLLAILGSGAILCRLAYERKCALRDAMFTAVLLAAYLPFMQYSIFIYGNALATVFMLGAVYCAVHCAKTFSWKTALGAACLLAMAGLLKSNSVVALVAILIVYLLAALRTRGVKPLVAALLCATLFFLPAKGVQAAYEHRAGIEHLRGTPMTVYLSMGLTDSDVLAPGWYNGESYTVLEDAAYDYDVAAARLRVALVQRLAAMKNDLGGTASFFLRKTQSVWVDPTFGANFIGLAHTQPRFAAEYQAGVYATDARSARTVWLGTLQTLVYMLAAVALWQGRKMPQSGYLTALIFFGGVLFLTISEGKTQYSLQYFMLLLPWAGQGTAALASRAQAALVQLAKKEAK